MMRMPALVALLSVFFLAQSPQAQHAGRDFYENLADLPYLYPDDEAHYLSSYDRTGGNDDGFRGTYSALRVDDKGEHVIFDESGPGCIYNLWFTDTGGEKSPLRWGKMRFYFDNETSPRIQMDANEFFSGDKPPFVYPLVTHNYISSGGYSCSMPFPFATHLKITTEKRAGFYNIYYHLYKSQRLASWSGKEDYGPLISRFERCGSDPKGLPTVQKVRKDISLPKRRGRDKVAPTLIYSREGGGVIQAIKMNPLFPPDQYILNHVFLRITWDNQAQPAVNVPIGPFFGSGLGEADVRSLLFGMSSSGDYYCYFPMPFRKSARIELVNESYDSGADLFCEVVSSTDAPKEQEGARLGYFAARYKTAWPIVTAEDYTLLEYGGAGSVVGQVMTVEPVVPDRKRWWEGDMRIWIDGESKPRFHGTGHEDEYQGGWSSFWLMNPYSLPLFGEPKTTGLRDIYGQINGSTTVYRIWPGGIPFQKSVAVRTEHGNQNDTPANYSSVVFYYFLP